MSQPTIQTVGGILPGEAPGAGISFAARLGSGETITGTPTVDVSPESGVTVSAISVNTAIERIDGRFVAAGKGVLFRVTAADSAVADDVYQLTVAVATTGGQILKESVNCVIL